MSNHPPNAIPGPSTLPQRPPSPPLLFLPPPAAPPPPPIRLSGTQDLLARLQLLPAYDKHVRPFIQPVGQAHDHPPTPTSPVKVEPVDTKGKGKEKELDSPAPGEDEDEATGMKEGRRKKNYKHLIKGVPGKHSMKKDSYLMDLMTVPPKERLPITPFDLKTQQEAFSVSLEGLKGWNPSLLVLESAQAREDRKRRKELKKLAKAAASQPPPPQMSPAAIPMPAAQLPTPRSVIQAPAPRNAVLQTPTPATHVSNTRTPKPALAPVQTVVPRGSGPAMGTGTGTPTTPATASPLEKKGKKRERDDSVSSGLLPSGGKVLGMGGGNLTNNTAVKRPAMRGGVPARPKKKQRMDSQGQAREGLPVQQPTPHGV